MHPRHFGESHDMAKRDIMQWLAPGPHWAAHPMWFNDRRGTFPDWPFLEQYAAALDVRILEDEQQDTPNRFQSAQGRDTHLLLDPDTGLSGSRAARNSRKLVSIQQFVDIVNSLDRHGMITLIYDQSYTGTRGGIDIWQQTSEKLQSLHRAHIHAVAYMAHVGMRVRFIWASTCRRTINDATNQMQEQSHYPFCRFLDDGCDHVNIPP